MKQYSIINLFVMAVLLFSVTSCTSTGNKENAAGETESTATTKEITNPLTSWNESTNKTDIINYVKVVTDKNSNDFIPVADRIAVFDNDGTCMSEHPMYFQLYFVIDRVKELAPQHPDWKNIQPFKSVLENDMKALAASGMNGLMEMLMATHAGMTHKEFMAVADQWLKTAKHPTKNQLYTNFVYKPMLELFDYLKANDFDVYIVSAGGVQFMRNFIPEYYGIPVEKIIGSSIKTKYMYNDGAPYIERDAGVDFVNDKGGKPVNINKIIGKKPVFAGGNSDADMAMLQWTSSNTKYKTFELIVHHTDSVREWKYDRNTHFGKLDKGLDVANASGWHLIDMKNDWETVFINE